MKITKKEREVIREIRDTHKAWRCLAWLDLLPEIREMYRSIARWHLAKLKESRADGYMDAVTKQVESEIPGLKKGHK